MCLMILSTDYLYKFTFEIRSVVNLYKVTELSHSITPIQ